MAPITQNRFEGLRGNEVKLLQAVKGAKEMSDPQGIRDAIDLLGKIPLNNAGAETLMLVGTMHPDRVRREAVIRLITEGANKNVSLVARENGLVSNRAMQNVTEATHTWTRLLRTIAETSPHADTREYAARERIQVLDELNTYQTVQRVLRRIYG